VDDNQPVKAGDVLVEIDPADYLIARDQALAMVAAADANLTNKEIRLKRQQSMTTLSRSKQTLDDATAEYAQGLAMQAGAKSKLAQAEKDLKDAILSAPEDGVVTNRSVEQGAYVQAGSQLMALVGNKRWVTANYKETQLTAMKPGQKADIEVDAYPDLKLEGHVDSIQRGTGSRFSLFPAENATGNYVKIVQRVPVKILIDSDVPEGVVLGPGMSVVPTVHTN
jgi:membrane fusion protein (multidrug efflux system)